MTSSRRVVLVSLISLWATAAVGGMTMLMASTRRPDSAATDRPLWPVDVSLARSQNGVIGPTIVVCLHPRCPCSEATLDTLETLLASARNKTAYAIFSMPDQPSAQWTDVELIRRAKSIKGLTVILDAGGQQCAAFGAKSSGQAFLYDTGGRLAFAGGLTPGRGEVGASVGSAFVARVLSDEAWPTEVVRSDVFGCALYHLPSGSPR
ncbi:MAG: redB [Phycisphaerales bacterium]|nr:redB [Phycisphaerales bacterium]